MQFCLILGSVAGRLKVTSFRACVRSFCSVLRNINQILVLKLASRAIKAEGRFT